MRLLEIIDYCSFLDACKIISAIIGRNILGGEEKPAKPKLSPGELRRAELFAIGYAWWLSRYLDLLKELWLLDENAVEDGRIYQVTQLLNSVHAWSQYHAAVFLEKFWPANREFVAERIEEARMAELELKTAIEPRGRARRAA